MESRISDNNGEGRLPPFFIEIQKSENIKIKIPCANEAIARKILSSFRITSNKLKFPSVNSPRAIGFGE